MADNEKKEETINITTEYQFSKKAKLKECKYCCVMVPKKAKICPNCKMSLKKRWLRNLLSVIILFAFIAAAAAGGYYYFYEYPKTQTTSVNITKEDAEVTEEATATSTVAEEATIEENTDAVESVVKDEEATVSKDEQSLSLEAASIEMPEILEVPEEDAEPEEDAQIEEDTESEKDAETEKDVQSEKNTEAEEDVEVDADIQKDDSEEADELYLAKDEYEEFVATNSLTQISYKDMLRKQEAYKNTEMVLEMTVLSQVDGGLFDDNVYYLCVGTDEQGIERYYIIRDDREEDALLILEGDVLRIQGTLFDRCKLPADLVKTQPTVPALAMSDCELVEE